MRAHNHAALCSIKWESVSGLLKKKFSHKVLTRNTNNLNQTLPTIKIVNIGELRCTTQRNQHAIILMGCSDCAASFGKLVWGSEALERAVPPQFRSSGPSLSQRNASCPQQGASGAGDSRKRSISAARSYATSAQISGEATTARCPLTSQS